MKRPRVYHGQLEADGNCSLDPGLLRPAWIGQSRIYLVRGDSLALTAHTRDEVEAAMSAAMADAGPNLRPETDGEYLRRWLRGFRAKHRMSRAEFSGRALWTVALAGPVWIAIDWLTGVRPTVAGAIALAVVSTGLLVLEAAWRSTAPR